MDLLEFTQEMGLLDEDLFRFLCGRALRELRECSTGYLELHRRFIRVLRRYYDVFGVFQEAQLDQDRQISASDHRDRYSFLPAPAIAEPTPSTYQSVLSGHSARARLDSVSSKRRSRSWRHEEGIPRG
ncbi:hypothetical protein BGZ54_001799 [Gamsiella multidivaricata]|nr:hypothetical protein BGZ54_001799 [Gamsiella multidivaricata]